MDAVFWEGKKVLITGHTGFKGSWLSLWLKSMGADIVGVSLDPPTTPSLYEQACVAGDMVSLREDIRDLHKMKDIFTEYQPEIVFHLAAQPLVRYSYSEPVETYATNVMGTLHILEAIRASKSVRTAAVMITTDKCYENHEQEQGYSEDEPMGGHDPYSSSKGCAELLISSYRDSYFPKNEYPRQHQTAIASARAGNVIGGGDWAEDRLIPDAIRAFQDHETVQIRNPNAIRPWQHVLEPLVGYIELAERLYTDGTQWAEAWNFGPKEEDEKSVELIIKEMTQLWGNDANWQHDEGTHPHEARYLKLDCSKARNKLKWSPIWNLSRAMVETVRWYKAWHNQANMHDFTLQQIKTYQQEQLAR